ncbi:hypothetical protein M8009_02860 [Halomonas sp. ATCH28]|uniref:Sulfotransferase family protein n=1 Tax=Halomonas gemina TaxID=2945105 RepID=A0ABT0SYP6_9GAMM|nr:hypothetical protein [Halomonas gemina]MCL7939245.1 hypothetical protein [Halomonas gemina]
MKDSLVNKGVAILGKCRPIDGKPIVVVGTARGGTSMVAGALSKLGVFMGETATPPVYEDLKLSAFFENKDYDSALETVRRYNASYKTWGWKRPSNISYLQAVHKTLDSPFYVFVFKDIFSIAHRNNISMKQDIIKGMKNAVSQYEECLRFIEKNNPNSMFVSYEKVINNTENFVHELKKFSGLSPSEQQISDAIAFIRPSPEDYLDKSRITKAQGRVDAVNKGLVRGWAKYDYNKKIALVDIYRNDALLGTVKANSPREDLEKTFGQACAFNFELPSGVEIKKGDVIKAKVSDEINFLNNTPYIFEE